MHKQDGFPPARGKDRSRDERMLVGRLPRAGGGPHAVTRVDSCLREEHPSYWREILRGGLTETVILRDGSVSSPSPSFTVRSCCRDHGNNSSIVVSDAGDSNINADINATHCGQSCVRLSPETWWVLESLWNRVSVSVLERRYHSCRDTFKLQGARLEE